MMRTLYEITNDYKILLDMLLDPESDPEAVKDTLEGMEGELAVKLDSYKIVDSELEAEEEKLTKEIERLTKLKNSIKSNRDILKERMTNAVFMLPDQKIDTEHYKFKMVKNGGLQPLEILDYDSVPEEYLIPQPAKIDNDKVRKYLAGLTENDSCEWATLHERGQRLSIK